MYVPVKNGLKVTTLCITIEYSKGLGLYLGFHTRQLILENTKPRLREEQRKYKTLCIIMLIYAPSCLVLCAL